MESPSDKKLESINMPKEEKEDEEKEDEEDQILKIENEYAQTVINIEKRDKDTKKPIKGAVFELYSKDDIYNGAGEKISQANDYIACAETDENGDACFYMPKRSFNFFYIILS